MKRKPKRLKTYRTWCVVRPDGWPRYLPEARGTSKAQVQRWLEDCCDNIVQVEVRQVKR